MSEPNKILFTNKEDIKLKALPYHSRMQTTYITYNPSRSYKSYNEIPFSNDGDVILTTRVEREPYIEFKQVELKRGDYIKTVYTKNTSEKDKIPNNKLI